MGDNIAYIMENSRVVAAIVLAFYALAVVCAVRELMNSRTSQGSIAWILSLAIMPFVTVPLYMTFGWKLFDDYGALLAFNGRKNRAGRARELGIVDEATSSKWPVLTHVSQLPFLKGNKTDLLIDGTESFASIFEGIARAQTYTLVQFYTIRDDRLGIKLADLLIERAQAGVDVMVLYDDIGSSGLSKDYINRLKSNGVRISGFNHRHKFMRFYGPLRINYRNHRKVVVVDGREAWVGGHNVAIDYLGENPLFGYWRDTHVHVRGPAALACALMFREDWEWSTGQQLSPEPPEVIEYPGDESVLVMPTGPADKLEGCAIAFTDVISRAQKRLWIVSPYFVPELDVQTALYAAAMRGVDVRILLPEKADHMLVWLAGYAHADSMVDHGVPIYRYQKGFLHQKVILVDDEIAGIGTVNFDNRSFAINFEVTLWFTHPNMIAKVDNMLKADFGNARATTADELRQRPLIFRVVAQLARLLSPML